MASKQNKQSGTGGYSFRAELVRRFKANPFLFIGTIVILIIVIIAFVFVPAIVPEAVGRSISDLKFGSYNKIPITYVPGNYFAQIYSNYARYMQNSINETNYQSMEYQIWRTAFEETVVHIGILQEMEKAGYKAPETVVDRTVAGLPQFQDESGRFSPARYRQLDSASRISLWREVQDSIAEEQYKTAVTGLRVSSTEGDFIRDMALRERSFDMALFPFSSYPNEEVAAYAQTNPDLFRVTHLSKITINSGESEARQILASIQERTVTFEDAAKNQSMDSYAERGGDMGVKMAYELASEVPDAQERETVIGTVRGAISPIVKVPSGWAFFRAEEAPYPVNTEDTASLDKIRTYILDFELGRVEDWLINQANEFVSAVKAGDFDSVLEERNLEKRSFGPLPLNYGGVDLFTALASVSVAELSSAESNENFWKSAFFTDLNTPADPIVLGNNVVVLYPKEETIKDTADAESIKTAYDSYWLSYNAERSLRTFFITNENLEDNFMTVYLQNFMQIN
jgi:hypothetical protein